MEPNPARRPAPLLSGTWLKSWGLGLLFAWSLAVPFAVRLIRGRGFAWGGLGFSDAFLLGYLATGAVVGALAISLRSHEGMRTRLARLLANPGVATGLSLCGLQGLMLALALREKPDVGDTHLLLWPAAVGALALCYPALRILEARRRRPSVSQSRERGPHPPCSAELITAGAIAFTFAVTAACLAGRTTVNGDEAATAVLYATDALTALTSYTSPNNHPLHTFLASLSLRGLGLSDLNLRLPALLAGILLPVAAGALAVRLGGASALAVAVALIASQGVWLRYASEARGYSLASLLALATLFDAASRRPRDLIRAGIWSTLGLFTVPTNVYVTLAILVTAVAESRRGPWGDRVRARALAVAMAWSIAWSAILWSNLLLLRLWLGLGLDFGHGHLSIGAALADLGQFMPPHADIPSAIIAVLVIGVFFSIRSYLSRHKERGPRLVIGVALLSPAMVLLIATVQGRLPYARNLLPILAVVTVVSAVVVSDAIRKILPRWFVALLLVLAIGVFGRSWGRIVTSEVGSRAELDRTCPAADAAIWLRMRGLSGSDRVLFVDYMFDVSVAWYLKQGGTDVALGSVSAARFLQPLADRERLFIVVGDPYPADLAFYGRASRGCCAPSARRTLFGHHLICEQLEPAACAAGRHPSSELLVSDQR